MATRFLTPPRSGESGVWPGPLGNVLASALAERASVICSRRADLPSALREA
jgi:hypothetical protein